MEARGRGETNPGLVAGEGAIVREANVFTSVMTPRLKSSDFIIILNVPRNKAKTLTSCCLICTLPSVFALNCYSLVMIIIF